jgi:hypothetical protein
MLLRAGGIGDAAATVTGECRGIGNRAMRDGARLTQSLLDQSVADHHEANRPDRRMSAVGTQALLAGKADNALASLAQPRLGRAQRDAQMALGARPEAVAGQHRDPFRRQ